VLYFTSRFKSPLCMHHLKIDQEIEPPDLPSPNPSDSDNRLPLSTCPSMTTNRASCVIDIKCEVQADKRTPNRGATFGSDLRSILLHSTYTSPILCLPLVLLENLRGKSVTFVTLPVSVASVGCTAGGVLFADSMSV